MANEVLQKVGGQIRFLVAGSFSPVDVATNWTIGTPTDVVLTMAGVVAAAARQSTKFDFGEQRAAAYECLAAVDFTGETITTPGTYDIYFAPSTHATSANGNVAGNSGLDADAPGGALGSIILAEFLLQCVFIGSLVLHDGGVVQNGYVGTLHPTSRYGQIIAVNNCDSAIEADDVENHIVLNPIIDEVQ